MWPGQKMSLEVDQVLLNGKSEFQDILVFKSKTYGNVLVLDGVIQLTERDEFAYQEMITHIPLFAHKQPKKVLIVGGGDGGVLREVAKHSCVETIHMCEIDKQVVECGKSFFSQSVSYCFNDPRLTLLFDDAARYLLNEGKTQGYDVIICDSSDPVGPAEVLFRPEFFQSMKDALAPGGILCTQGECQWLHLDLIASVIGNCREIFPSLRYAYTTIPTYPSGQIGFIVASNDGSVDPAVPARRVPEGTALKYYTSSIHRSAFILPAFTAEKIGQHIEI
jgi:spermidine synthase